MIQEIKNKYYEALLHDSIETRLHTLKIIKQKLISVLLNPNISKEEKKEAYAFLHEISFLTN